MTTVVQKLQQLRQLMQKKDIEYYFVPTRDDHHNEYVPSHWKRREWLTGFTGSYGEALIGQDHAYLWTDPRYYLQAEQQLNASEITLMKQIQGVSAPIAAWLSENVRNAIVTVDPKVMSIVEQELWSKALSQTHSELTAIPENLVDTIWKDRPAHQYQPAHVLDEKYTGLSVSHKLKMIRDEMKKIGADHFIISPLDEIAWLFNIRGSDVPYNPLLISYAIISATEAALFLDPNAIASNELSYFSKNNIELKPYANFEDAIQRLQGNVWVDPRSTSWWVALQCDSAILIEKTSPIVMLKAVKNETEIKGMHEAHRIDAIAMVKFLQWIENHWRDGITEVTAADQLEKFRREDARCKDLSFSTICGFADHGAIVHYFAHAATAHTITDQNLILIDSGGQYFEGTTDITRTIHLGNPTLEQKKHYTLVLKGHLALRHMPFPRGVTGEHIDALARAPLWQAHLDYGHGTGHGVGCYLCVHEGPQRISYGASGVALRPGMMVSNEPGLYFTGKYGIRIENVCEITQDTQDFLIMRDVTMVPYARRLIDVALLTDQEIVWIDEYHRAVFALLEKDLSSEIRDWLQSATQPLK
ncbi:MAG: hypothetical protein A3I77_04720 [Gammaproteobacteria bacterium RIFCSPLOWO2_02_FULL_42_14]|nr:MAG: hypothetical protein A3B71_06020 [Gammaproteobacteria bacterium RIFCSPHIGHO2_02_FULL_42_43]OGT28967.1 MAG: hypothetical protein A2624_02965 [Gammaproteobacteria bacterium RIFCSPHIGHO2_01_FULL_42_8]OGT51542.1 MAG: hypothetical protein A3E54_05785 [Gammaproteobacteria bacterium RIFCSPHIGHO2_12_FULL_41_25]OGT62241.1 MAG: hypothetical protein A3I77_04720 [Gammaproteobacteria bacterium RIFCSPLOWO2_02_FULL_42_14]OGT85916.1 MAG: hypothetical protein A3G86_04410 [Gammaproteobacteria bacterium R